MLGLNQPDEVLETCPTPCLYPAYSKPIFATINQPSLLTQFLVYCTPTEIQTPIFPLEGERPIQLDDGGVLLYLRRDSNSHLVVRSHRFSSIELRRYVVCMMGVEPNDDQDMIPTRKPFLLVVAEDIGIEPNTRRYISLSRRTLSPSRFIFHSRHSRNRTYMGPINLSTAYQTEGICAVVEAITFL